MAHARCMLNKQGYTRANTCLRPLVWTPTHARAHTHTHNMQYLFLFHCNNGYVNVPHCYVIRTLAVFFQFLAHDSECTNCVSRALVIRLTTSGCALLETRSATESGLQTLTKLRPNMSEVAATDDVRVPHSDA
jgi:hypothetical protein